MKKLLTAIIASFFIGSFALAETSIGIKISSATMDASGSHTTNSSSGGSGGTAVNASGEGEFNMGSFFIEKNTGLDFNGVGITLGLDVIPFTAEVDKLGGGDGFDANSLALRHHLHKSDSMQVAYNEAFRSAGLGDVPDQSKIAVFDFYSCFPIAVEQACKCVGLHPYKDDVSSTFIPSGDAPKNE